MALYIDREISTMEDLRRYESSILDTASIESVNLSDKLNLATDEIGVELSTFVQKRRSPYGQAGTELDGVVITEALRQWHTLHTLALVYRDVYHIQLNDRYGGKWKQYEELARCAAERTYENGVGMVAQPIRRADAPTLTAHSGGGLPGTHFIVMTWQGQSGDEGTPSEIASLTITAAEKLVVTPGAAPQNATGWNVYAGLSPWELKRQNSAPIAPGNAWEMPGSGPVDGKAPRGGQLPDFSVRDNRILQRG